MCIIKVKDFNKISNATIQNCVIKILLLNVIYYDIFRYIQYKM